MGRWRATAALLLNRSATTKTINSLLPIPNLISCLPKALHFSYPLSHRLFSAIPSRVSDYSNDIEYGPHDLAPNYILGRKEDEEFGKIPVKAYFLCTRFVYSIGFVLFLRFCMLQFCFWMFNFWP